MVKINRTSLYIYFSLFLFLLMSGLIMLWTENYNLLLLMATILFVLGLVYSLRNIYENIFLFCFLICFFTFLLGGQILNTFFHVYGYNFPTEIENHTNLLLLISIAGLLAGYFLSLKIEKKKTNESLKIDYESSYFKNARKISKYYFYVTYCFWLLILLDNVLYVLQNGYTAYYLSYSSRIPAILREIGYMSPVALFIYLSTMPKKKDAKIPILLYIAYLVISLGTGRRIYFMTGILIIFGYMMIRNVVAPEDKPWVSKKSLIKICILIPILLITMYLFEYVRSGDYVGNASNWSPIVGFFVRQGTSINVIKYTDLFFDRLNPDAHYSLYNTIRWLQNSFFNEFLNLDLNFVIGKQTQETAIAGTYLADFVSYNANKAIYSEGMGYGSCYIAELYVDFGYIGVLLGNMLFGGILCKLLKTAMNNGNIWMSAIGLYMIDAIFQAPRATFDSFFGSLLYFNSWGPLVLVYVITSIYNTRNKNSIKNQSKSHILLRG